MITSSPVIPINRHQVHRHCIASIKLERLCQNDNILESEWREECPVVCRVLYASTHKSSIFVIYVKVVYKKAVWKYTRLYHRHFLLQLAAPRANYVPWKWLNCLLSHACLKASDSMTGQNRSQHTSLFYPVANREGMGHRRCPNPTLRETVWSCRKLIITIQFCNNIPETIAAHHVKDWF